MSLFTRPPPIPTPSFLRAFSTTTAHFKKQPHFKPLRNHDPSQIPSYPHGPSLVYKQSNLGLYGLSKIKYGNIVSSKNEIKTRRHWRPNVRHKALFSELLNSHIRVRITTQVLRTVDKCGGIDNYLLGDSEGRVRELGVYGWAVRWRLMQTEGWRKRERDERVRLGLEEGESEVLRGLDGEITDQEGIDEEVRTFDEALEGMQEIPLEEGLEGLTGEESEVREEKEVVRS